MDSKKYIRTCEIEAKKYPWSNIPKDITKHYGFIYMLYNKTQERYYIGQKRFWFKETKYKVKVPTKVERLKLSKYDTSSKTYKNYKKKLSIKYKGKKRKLRSYVESDWERYFGSSDILKERVGKDVIYRFILDTCTGAWELDYKEAKEIINRDALIDDKYYNGYLRLRIGKPPKYKTFNINKVR